MGNNNLEEKLFDEINNYETTLRAIQSFISLILYDKSTGGKFENSNDSIGRRMQTSERNRISPSVTVTPDIVIQNNNSFGYVCEAKKSLCKDTNHWKPEWEQIIKYDDNLKGWWTSSEYIDEFCVVLLIDYSRSIDFSDFVDELIKDNSFLQPINKISIVEFSQQINSHTYISFRKIWGMIEDEDLNNILHSSKLIPLHKVIANPLFGSKKFYDAEPPVEYTMAILWGLFNEKKTDDTYNEEENCFDIKIILDEITREIQGLYGSEGGEHDVEYPKQDWIERAVERFVNIELAESLDDKREYVIHFKKIKTDNVIEYFYKKSRKTKKKDVSLQPELF